MKRIFGLLIIIVFIPALIVLGGRMFREQSYTWLAVSIALLSLVPVFLNFEKKDLRTERLILIAVMTALSAASRMVFAYIPHFKPITALIIITGIYLGAESGFVTGALSALISNFLFGQGAWTPMQMFSWGIIGCFAGLLHKPLQKSLPLTVLYGAVSGVLYSLLMDLYSTLWFGGEFSIARYGAMTLTSMSTTILYVISNVLFLLLLTRPVGKKLERIHTKYGF